MDKEEFRREDEKINMIDTYIRRIHRRYEPEPNLNILPRFRQDIEKERILWHKKHNKIVEKIIYLLDKIDDLYDNRPKMSEKDMEEEQAILELTSSIQSLPEPSASIVFDYTRKFVLDESLKNKG